MRRRGLRWIVVALVVLIGLYLVGDIVTLQYLENRGGAEIARSMSAEDATVKLGTFPFLPGFLRGRLDNVVVTVQGASASGGLRVEKVEATLGTTEFSAGKLFALARSSFATRTKVTAKDVTGRIVLKEQDLEDYIRNAVPVVGDVQVKSTGLEVRFLKPDIEIPPTQQPTKEDLTPPARYLPFVRDGKLFLSLTGVAQIDPRNRVDASRLEELIKLPRIPSGLVPQVSYSDGLVVIEVQGGQISLTVGEGED